MSAKRSRFFGWYARIFMSERTITIVTALALATIPLILFFGNRAGTLNMTEAYDMLIRFCLVATLYHSLRVHKLLLMQAATVGLLICMLCAQSHYALGDLASLDSEVYITIGLRGFIFLAVERMILLVQSLVCINHFAVHTGRRRSATRMFVNRTAIIFLLVLLVVQLIAAPTLGFGRSYVLHIWTLHLDELFVYIQLVCAEQVLLVDSMEFMGV